MPGDIGFNPGEGNAPNLNAGIPGGGDGAAKEKAVGHGLCGDKGDRKAFMVRRERKGKKMELVTKRCGFGAGVFLMLHLSLCTSLLVPLSNVWVFTSPFQTSC